MYPGSIKNDTAEETAYLSPADFTSITQACLCPESYEFSLVVLLHHPTTRMHNQTESPADDPLSKSSRKSAKKSRIHSFGSNADNAPRLRRYMCQFVPFTFFG